ncbi:aspartate aminotransferase family protein [Terricaulis silvestris]|uniref:Glutamate-1-semialdehyde 2,1-aminomutase 2 n=1 Tax=Terricaulis silvestris TaxID=2686094 RepID=A0A6I6MWM7_9CAUL|nr:aspartate aminotransferase family protein [Terricaulis silvestris]QGZ96814.1 Glutamate-1-semialdehyde 2,1-aminomutase 2 [Terricaulis silvestris]
MSLANLIARETQRFLETHPKSAAQAKALDAHWLFGAPFHWMKDWAAPVVIIAEDGEGAVLTDIDDNTYDDFCLGDTPGMFGHGRPEIARAVAEQARRGATFMLPTQESAEVGALLAERFGLPFWQTTLSASDANRALIRWARAVTGKSVIVVFDGCYHGMVEDCLVELRHGRTRPDAGLIGQVFDMTRTTRAVSFNDIGALEAALAQGDVAAVLAEPAMTNCGMILPEPNFWKRAQALATKAGALLILDETHTLSTGPGGATKTWGLAPDALVIGKAIAGGFPAAVWGVSAELGEKITAAKTSGGRSGIGTTLAGNAMGIAAIGATLREVATAEAYDVMLAGAEALVAKLRAVIAKRALPWCVVHVGARAEIVFAPEPPRNAAEMRPALAQGELNHALHLYLINRGVLIAPFHMMMLVCPATTTQQIDRLVAAVDSFAEEFARESA